MSGQTAGVKSSYQTDGLPSLFFFQIFDWNNIPLSSVPLEHIPQMIEHCDMDAVKATIQTGG